MEKKSETKKQVRYPVPEETCCKCKKDEYCFRDEFFLYKNRQRLAELEILKIKEVLRAKLNEPYW